MSVKNNNEITKNKSKIGQKLSRKSLLIMLGGGTIAIIVIGVGVHYIYRTRDSNPITPIEIKKPGDKTKEVISDADASQKETPPKIIELEELETDDASHTLTTTENKKATKNNDFTHVYTNAYSEIENINEDERDLINHAKNSDEVV
ncbi:13776_t:CDS:2 [Gigaspora margarita]|uniref:13776_t:CDS:1 n=1 Tax=Gigaspora margarita TaxID=4874 RepID=A0ABM8VZU7_GIGMA|nr:13776_t:CDS:2 [Gigaspora margarita]